MTTDDADLALRVLRADAALGYDSLARDEVVESLSNGDRDGVVWEIYEDAQGRRVLWAYRYQLKTRYKIPMILHISAEGFSWGEALAIWRERLKEVAAEVGAAEWVTIFFQKRAGGRLHERYVEGLKIPELDREKVEVHDKNADAVRFRFRVSGLGSRV